ncbi:hypothetical protein AAVH_26337 [Aphelenchoides avenae]|nr:hypothetical protein AAVH_26337 [Aphelenchus avenae]
MKKLTIGIANGRGVDNLQQVPENRRDLEENGFDWTVIPNVHLPETGTFYTTVPERLEHIRCSVDVETHMWWFLQVSSDATRLKAHAEKVGVEAILGANDANVHYVFRRIQQYMEKLGAPQTWRPWYTDVYAEIFKNVSNPCSPEEAEVRKLEAYNRECAVLTYFGHIASRVFEYEFIFLAGRCVATVWYKFIEPCTLLILNYGCDTRRELHAYCLHYLVTTVAKRMGCTQIHWLVRDHLVPATETHRLALQAEANATLVEFYYARGCIARSVRYEAFASLVTAYRPLSRYPLEHS